MCKSIDLFFDKQEGSQLINYIRNAVFSDDLNHTQLDENQIDKMHI